MLGFGVDAMLMVTSHLQSLIVCDTYAFEFFQDKVFPNMYSSCSVVIESTRRAGIADIAILMD